MARICLIKGQSQYDVMRLFSDLLADALRPLGHDIAILDMATPDWPRLAGEVFEQPTDMVLSFNAVGIDLKIEETSLYARLGITFVGLLLDHPLHHLERIETAPPGSLFVCVDQTHASFLLRHFQGRRSAAFLPHAGMTVPGPVRPSSGEAFDLVFSGTCTDPDEIRAGWSGLPASIRRLFEDIADELLASEEAILHEAVDHVLARHGLHPAQPDRAAFFAQLRPVDHYVRAVRRRAAVRTLVAGGVKLDVFGANWADAGLGDAPNLRIHAAVPLREALGLMKRARMTLNIMPAFPRGAHDRIFSALLCGSVPVSDTNSYIASLFEDARDGVFFRWRELDQLPERVRALLADDAQLEAIATRGRERCTDQHDWAARARQLLELIEAHRIMHSLTQPGGPG